MRIVYLNLPKLIKLLNTRGLWTVEIMKFMSKGFSCLLPSRLSIIRKNLFSFLDKAESNIRKTKKLKLWQNFSYVLSLDQILHFNQGSIFLGFANLLMMRFLEPGSFVFKPIFISILIRYVFDFIKFVDKSIIFFSNKNCTDKNTGKNPRSKLGPCVSP